MGTATKQRKLRPPVKRQEGDVRYAEHTEWPGYCFGSDGTVWSCLLAGGGYEAGWHPVKPWIKDCGHACVSLRRGGRTFKALVHRLILEVFIGPCPAGMECLHGDAGPAVNSLSNIRWGSRSENTTDRHRQGFVNKLSRDQVRDIKVALRMGSTGKAIAKRYGVTPAMVSAIKTSRSWAWVR